MDLCLSPRWFHGSHSLSHLNPMAQHTGINLAISNAETKRIIPRLFSCKA